MDYNCYLHVLCPQAVLDNVEADFNLVNSMIDTINAEANRLSTEAGLPPLLPPGAVPPDGAARLSERITGVRSLMQRMCEELLVLDAEKRWGLQDAWVTATHSVAQAITCTVGCVGLGKWWNGQVVSEACPLSRNRGISFAYTSFPLRGAGSMQSIHPCQPVFACVRSPASGRWPPRCSTARLSRRCPPAACPRRAPPAA